MNEMEPMNSILIVDDEPNILVAYKRMMEKKYAIKTAASGSAGLTLLDAAGPFSVVISDYRMPGMNGIKFLTKVRELHPDTIRVILTGYADVSLAIEAVNEGNVFRFLTKPCPHDRLMSAVESCIEQYRLVTAEKELLDKTLKGSIKVMIDVLTVANPAAFERAKRLRLLAGRIASELELRNSWKVEVAALLSQIGWIAVPGGILEKSISGEDMSKEEEELMHTYPDVGKNLIRSIPRLEDIADAIGMQLEHHRTVGESGPDTNRDSETVTRILQAALDYDMLIHSGKPAPEAVASMQKYRERYDLRVLSALETIASETIHDYITKEIRIDDLRAGMVVAEDIVDLNGFSLLTKGNELSEAMLMRLQNFNMLQGIREPVRIHIRPANKSIE
jgi:response regulator RpfG family c-di-GMP phosphodiesterase